LSHRKQKDMKYNSAKIKHFLFFSFIISIVYYFQFRIVNQQKVEMDENDRFPKMIVFDLGKKEKR